MEDTDLLDPTESCMADAPQGHLEARSPWDQQSPIEQMKVAQTSAERFAMNEDMSTEEVQPPESVKILSEMNIQIRIDGNQVAVDCDNEDASLADIAFALTRATMMLGMVAGQS